MIRVFRRLTSVASALRCPGTSSFLCQEHQSRCVTTTSTDAVSRKKDDKERGKWLTLPPFKSAVDGAALGRELARRRPEGKRDTIGDGGETTVTALKWVLRCCPELPRSLVQKLFRLRQVRREFTDAASISDSDMNNPEPRLKRISAKDLMNMGDRIVLPITVQEFPTQKPRSFCDREEMQFIRGLEVYKDPAIIVINKPPGMAVQGGSGIRNSLDELAETYLRYDYSEAPRLVHRLDRDCSGILVMARTQTSARVLHSVFREKTSEASDDDPHGNRILQKKYLALVIGSPQRVEGKISVPLTKIVVEDGKSERITLGHRYQATSSNHAVTEYRVIESSCHGYTWLELFPLTGRKHQLRVHCAEVLGTPIVGDYKYGWKAHRNMEPLSCPNPNLEVCPSGRRLPFGLELDKGSILDKQPYLHLHCKDMVLPDVSTALQQMETSSDCDLTTLDTLRLSAPLPSHMNKSWEVLRS